MQTPKKQYIVHSRNGMAVWRFNQACIWDEATVSLTRISDGRIIRKRG
jgi:hypothetical protein